MHHIDLFSLLVPVIAEAVATREATKLLGGGLQSFGQAAEQAKSQMTDNFPRSVEDFSQFTDKSKQVLIMLIRFYEAHVNVACL